MKISAYRHAPGNALMSALVAVVMFVSAPALSRAEALPAPVNAFYLKDIPRVYMKLEKLIATFKESGANTLIIDAPIAAGAINRDALTNAVFTSHQFGLNVFVIAPTRSMAAALAEHPDWEDMQYDLGSGTIQPTGKLDLFNPEAVEFLKALFKDIASYSIDGILFSNDLSYSDVEGMSTAGLERHRERLDSAVVPGEMYLKVNKDDPNGLMVEEYGEPFWKWAELKRDVLLDFIQGVMKIARIVNPDVRFGLPLHIAGFTTPVESLAHYSYDLSAFKKLDINYYWIAVQHRDMRAKQELSYRKSMELLSRITQSTIATIKDPMKVIIAVQTTSLAGKILPISEIEEATKMALKSPECGIAYMVGSDTALPESLTRKVFKRQFISQ